MSDATPSVLRFVVEGEPVPKGRPRFAVRKGKGGQSFVKPYTPAETEAYANVVRLVAQAAASAARWKPSKDDRYTVVIRVFRTHYDAGGDIDNYAKEILDAIIPKPRLPGSGIIADDRYVRGLGSSLNVDAKHPRVEVELRRFKKGDV